MEAEELVLCESRRGFHLPCGRNQHTHIMGKSIVEFIKFMWPCHSTGSFAAVLPGLSNEISMYTLMKKEPGRDYNMLKVCDLIVWSDDVMIIFPPFQYCSFPTRPCTAIFCRFLLGPGRPLFNCSTMALSRALLIIGNCRMSLGNTGIYVYLCNYVCCTAYT